MLYADLKTGIKLRCLTDKGCTKEDEIVEIYETEHGEYAYECPEGRHIIDFFNETDDHGRLLDYEVASGDVPILSQLIEALIIFKKYAGSDWVVYCTHEEMRVYIDTDKVSDFDKRLLGNLGFSADGDEEYFYSFEHGSC